MQVCAQCGHAADVARFCPQCFHPMGTDEDWRTGTAERPAVPATPDAPGAPPPPPLPPDLPASPQLGERPPVEPPPALTTPGRPRYPLWADAPAALAAPAPPGPPTDVVPAREEPRRRRRWLPWTLAVGALVVVAATGSWLLFGGLPGGADRARDTAAAEESSDDASTSPSPEESGESAESEAPEARGGEGEGRRDDGSEGGNEDRTPREMTTDGQANAPRSAPPGQDVDGRRVTFGPGNLIDGDPSTAWRTAGRATGTVLVIRLPEVTDVTEVGMVNGYAKRSGDIDWYKGHRKVRQVEWIFDDGTRVRQRLQPGRRGMQTRAVRDVSTRTVRVRLLDVGPVGRGPGKRDFTAVGEVSVLGTTG